MTVQINDSGTNNPTPFTTYVFDTYGASRPDIIQIENTTYAMVYSKSVWVSPYQITGNLLTLSISSNGTLIRKIDAVTYSTVNTNYDVAHCQYLNRMYRDVYALIYTIPSGSTARGYVSTLCISTTGSIYRSVSNVVFDFSLALKTATNLLPSFTNITNNIIGLCYQGDYDDGYIETIKVTISDKSSSLKNIISKSGAYAIKGNQTTFVATLRTTSGDKTLTLPIKPGWNYLVLTYDHSVIKFFNNLTNVSLPCNENIISTANPIIFGGFIGIYDEFAIYKTHLRDDEVIAHYNKY